MIVNLPAHQDDDLNFVSKMVQEYLDTGRAGCQVGSPSKSWRSASEQNLLVTQANICDFYYNFRAEMKHHPEIRSRDYELTVEFNAGGQLVSFEVCKHMPALINMGDAANDSGEFEVDDYYEHDHIWN